MDPGALKARSGLRTATCFITWTTAMATCVFMHSGLIAKPNTLKASLFQCITFIGPETSFAGFKNSIYLLGEHDKLIINEWTITSNLWRSKLHSQ